MKPEDKTFLQSALAAAQAAGHPFPEMAACEAALESSFGRSVLAIRGNNLFGMKVHKHEEYGKLPLPTREFQNGQWKAVSADWVDYPAWADCFTDRVATLRRLAPVYPHYAAALAATNASEYVTQVSQTWSTDPNRAEKCIEIYNEMASDWDAIGK